MNRRTWIIIGAVIVSVIGGIIFFTSRGKSVNVELVNVEQRLVEQTVSASGVVKSTREANLALPAVGIVYNLAVEEGESVTSGQLLAYLNNFSESQSAQAYKDARDIALRDIDLFKEQYEDNKDAIGGDDQYDIQLRRLNELLSRAEATYQSSLGGVYNTVLNAPFNGTVVDIYVEQGEVATAGTPIAKVADLDHLVFEIQLDQEDFGIVKVGQVAHITLDSYEDVVFDGTVLSLPEYADVNTEDFTVEIAIVQDNGHKPLLGMNGDAKIVIEKTDENAQALSFDTIFEDEEGDFVWVNDNGKAKKVHVELGLEGDIYTEVKSNLSDLQIIIPIDDTVLEEGTKVKIND